jgi:hypothetical protein
VAALARIAVLAVAFELAACGSGAASAPDSGVRGRAVIGPTCPVQRVPPDPSCRPRPLATKIAVLRASDRKRMATTRSGRDGRFNVRLRPGRYYLRGAGRGRPLARPMLVVVHAHRFAKVTLSFDSGIR